MRLLYNVDDLHDVISVLKFINNYTSSLGIKPCAVDTELVQSIVKNCKADFPHIGGIQTASAFKQVSNFVCFFIGQQPLPDPFPVEIIGPDLAKIHNHQNAMVAFALGEAALFQSTIKRKDGDVVVKNALEYSRHSYVDIIEALSAVSPVTHFKLVSVLFEQLVYKTNPHCQYPILGKK